MKCVEARNLILRKIDLELSDADSRMLDVHLDQCAGCVRHYRMLRLPRQIGAMTARLEASPHFIGILKSRIEDESRDAAFVQQFLGLAKSFIPSLAAVTLALVSVFAYLHLIRPPADLGMAYQRMFISENLPVSTLMVEQQKITDANILSAIANSESWRQESANLQNGTY